MKKKYTTPASTVVSLQTATIIAASRTNRYYDNQGDIVYDFDPVDVEEAD